MLRITLPGGGTDGLHLLQDYWLGWYYLSTILDDYSRYIIAWQLCTNMRAEDVTDTIELALTASGCDQAVVRHMPRLLSPSHGLQANHCRAVDNGSCYISGDLAEWLKGQNMTHVRGAPFHPQTQGKHERWHQTMKNRVLLETITCPAISNARLGLSSITTTTSATTRV